MLIVQKSLLFKFHQLSRLMPVYHVENPHPFISPPPYMVMLRDYLSEIYGIIT